MDFHQDYQTRRRRRPWDRVSWWYSLVLVLPIVLLAAMAGLSGTDEAAEGVEATPEQAMGGTVQNIPSAIRREVPPPDPAVAGQLTARAALVVDLTSREALFDLDADARVAPASTMKIVTALVARRVLALDDVVVIEGSDLILGDDYSKMGLQEGDRTTVRELLYGTLIVSGGDSALALARAGGQRLDPSSTNPTQRFVDEMNAYAAEIGMAGSHFANPVGIDAEDHYSTAWDMVRATEQLLADPVLAQIVATPEATITLGGQVGRELYLVSTNELVLDGESFGVKTGSTELAGECLVNATWKGDHQVVTVIMGSRDRYLDTRTLLGSIG